MRRDFALTCAQTIERSLAVTHAGVVQEDHVGRAALPLVAIGRGVHIGDDVRIGGEGGHAGQDSSKCKKSARDNATQFSSFRGARGASEPGIQRGGECIWIPGSRLSARPGMTGWTKIRPATMPRAEPYDTE